MRVAWREIFRNRENPARVVEFANRLIEDCGGVRQCIAQWREAMASAQSGGRLAVVVRSHVAMLVMFVNAEHARSESTATISHQLTDEQLTETKEQMICEWIASNQDEAAEIIRRAKSK
jgi:hypothetical protein